MENDRGTVQDESVSDNDGTIVGQLPFDYSGLWLLFTANDYISIADNDDLSPATATPGTDSGFSVAFWVNAIDVTGAQWVTKNQAHRDWDVYCQAEILRFLIWDASGNYIGQESTAAMTGIEGNDTHIVCAYDGGKTNAGIVIYTNGVIHATVAKSSGTYGGSSNRSSVVCVGAELNGTPSYANGNMSRIRIYKRTLTAAEVTTLYAANRTNETVATISTNNLSVYYSVSTDPGVRDLGSGGATGIVKPGWADGVWSITGTNAATRTEHAEACDGVDDYITTVSQVSTNTNNITVGAWIYWYGASGNSDDDFIVLNGDHTANGYALYLESSDSFNMYLQAGGVTNVDLNWTPPSNTWTHVAATRTTGDWTIYTNGRAHGTFTAPPITPSGTTRISADSAGAVQFFGLVDDPKIWDVAKDASGMLELVQQTQKPDNSNEAGY